MAEHGIVVEEVEPWPRNPTSGITVEQKGRYTNRQEIDLTQGRRWVSTQWDMGKSDTLELGGVRRVTSSTKYVPTQEKGLSNSPGDPTKFTAVQKERFGIHNVH